jgi:cephalosporin-C deacetylase
MPIRSFYFYNRFLMCVFTFALVAIVNGAYGSNLASTIKTGDADTTEQFYITAKPGVKNAIFKNNNNINYSVKLDNKYKQGQDGTLKCYVKSYTNDKIFEDSVKVHLDKKTANSYSFKIPIESAGFYKVSFMVNLTSYDDTVRKVFGYRPELINTELHKPADFDAFWKSTKSKLAAIPPQYKITLERALSVNKKTVYLVEMHSWGNQVIKGWLTIPNDRPKKIAVKYRLPGYIVKMDPSMDDDDFAVFNINVRGNGLSKDAINTHGEYNLYNLDNRDEYVYRAVYMDCVRGLDFLYSHAEMGLDTARIMVDGASQGGGLAIALAGLDNRIKLVSTQLPLYADFRDAFKLVSINDPEGKTTVGKITLFVKNHPNYTPEKVFKVWDYFDPLNFAANIKCPVLMGIGLLDEFCPPMCSFAMFNQLPNKHKDYYVSPDKTHELDLLYYTYQFYFLDENFRLQ